jgi:Zn-dependent metalloprotease
MKFSTINLVLTRFLIPILILGIITSNSFAVSKKINKVNKEQTISISPGDLNAMAIKLNKFYSVAKTNQIISSPDLLLNSNKNTNQPEAFLGDLYIESKHNVPFFMSGETLEKSSSLFLKQTNSDKMLNSTDIAISYIQDKKELFKLIDPLNELKIKETVSDIDGNHHVRLSQSYKGLPIWSKDITVHYDKDKIYLINGRYIPTPQNLDINNFKISYEVALKSVMDDLKPITSSNLNSNLFPNYTGPTAKKYIWCDDSGKPYLVWFVEVRPNIIDDWYYFIDATTGLVLEKYNNTKQDGPTTANAKDQLNQSVVVNSYLDNGAYYMIDASRPMFNGNISNPKGVIITYDNKNTDLTNTSNPGPVSSNNNQWNDAVSVSAHVNMGKSYQYFKDNHSRNSIDNAGMTIFAIIHVTDNNQSFANAFWNGQFLVFGDGGGFFKPLAGALDIVGHELTHGVITYSGELEYKNQSGALNEAIADWGGVMVDKQNWLIGEDADINGSIVKHRDMSNPHNGEQKGQQNWQPAKMSEFQTMPVTQDNGGVHVNSGIINKATFLIGTAIGKDKLEKIYYNTLFKRYLSTQAQFIDMRLATVKSATDLYGSNSNEVNAVKKAFDDVEIFDNTGTKQDPESASNPGEQWVAIVAAPQDESDHSLYVAKAKIINQSDIKQLTTTQVYSGSGKAITITDDGSVILFVDANNFIRGILPDGSNETVISQTGEWNSISISPDGKKLAATSNLQEPKIYLFDLVASTSKILDLYVPSSQTTDDIKPLYPDVIDFNLSGNLLIYDVANRAIKTNGTSYNYWEMNLYDLTSNIINRVVPTLGEGINIGNPSFAKNNKYVFTYEMDDAVNNMHYIRGHNLFSGDDDVIDNWDYSTNDWGAPCYSVDDKYIVYQYYNPNDFNYYIYNVTLSANKLKGITRTQYLVNARQPRPFAIGKRPVGVDEADILNTPSLSAYPNPTNDLVEINFTLDRSADVSLKVINLFGSIVKTLVNNNFMTEGNHNIELSTKGLSSGTYLIIMNSNQQVQTLRIVVVN